MLDKSETKTYKVGDLIACYENDESEDPILGMVTRIEARYNYEDNCEMPHYFVLWVDEVVEFNYWDLEAFDKVLKEELEAEDG